jgi:undecaprenyl-diphosphatase
MDLYLFQTINDLALKRFWLDVLGIFLAKYFEYILIFALVLIFLFRFKRYWKTVIGALISAALARLVIVNLIRWILPRSRPFIENNVNLLLDYSDKASFPSGHAAFYFALATVFFYKDKDVGALFLAGAILISLARIFVGIHWPSDILTGAIVGILSALLIKKIFKKF